MLYHNDNHNYIIPFLLRFSMYVLASLIFSGIGSVILFVNNDVHIANCWNYLITVGLSVAYFTVHFLWMIIRMVSFCCFQRRILKVLWLLKIMDVILIFSMVVSSIVAMSFECSKEAIKEWNNTKPNVYVYIMTVHVATYVFFIIEISMLMNFYLSFKERYAFYYHNVDIIF